MLQTCVGLNLANMSTLVTSQLIRSNASPTEPVPLKSSNNLGIFVMHDLVDVPLWVHFLATNSPRHFRRWFCSCFCFLSIFVCLFHFSPFGCTFFQMLLPRHSFTYGSFSSNFKQEAGCTTGTADIEVTQRKMLVVCVFQPDCALKRKPLRRCISYGIAQAKALHCFVVAQALPTCQTDIVFVAAFNFKQYPLQTFATGTDQS